MKERFTVYMVREKYMRLRSLLIARGVSFTAWLDEKITQYLEEDES